MDDTRRTIWEERWSQADFAPPWGGRGAPAEVVEAIRSAWLPAAGRMLDIGCGTGEVAAWFHQHGYESLGIDIARAAVESARERHGTSRDGLRFESVDICEQPPPGGPFDVIVDRGCLHGIPAGLISRYVKSVAAVSHDATRMLLFMRIHRGHNAIARVPFGARLEQWFQRRWVARIFRGLFTIERHNPTDLRGPAATRAMPGVAYHLVR